MLMQFITDVLNIVTAMFNELVETITQLDGSIQSVLLLSVWVFAAAWVASMPLRR